MKPYPVPFQPDYRQTLAEITAYFDAEPPRRMPAGQRLAVLSLLVGAYEDEDQPPKGLTQDNRVCELQAA